MKLYYRLKNTFYSLIAKKTVGARILLVKDEQVLLVKHTYQKGWYTIGGGVDAKESPSAAIRRELYEEVGVTLTNPPQLFAVYYSNYEKRDDYVVFYIGKEFTQEFVTSHEIADQQWFPLNALPDDVTPATKRRIAEYLGHKPISDRW